MQQQHSPSPKGEEKTHIGQNCHQVVTQINQQIQCSGQVISDSLPLSHPPSSLSSGHLPAVTGHLSKDSTDSKRVKLHILCVYVGKTPAHTKSHLVLDQGNDPKKL